MKPFLKWPGNKFSLANQLLPFIPKGRQYIEPFAGAAGLFCALADCGLFERFWLNDCNSDLINVLGALEDEGLSYIEDAKAFFTPEDNTEETYYEIRETFNLLPRWDYNRAVFFPYLNKHGYNGLCRYNAKGGYNVPFGRYDKPYFPEEELIEWLEKLQTISVSCLDFETVLGHARWGDVVYCDPPYHPISDTSSFTSYAHGWKPGVDDERLATACWNVKHHQGAHVVISAPYVQALWDLYCGMGAEAFEIEATRSIAANGEKRGKVKEYVFVM